jgi:pSer/pThr/pTyr-binding forkhead associated (FHA) protein
MSDAFLKILSGPREGLNIPLASSALLIGRKKGDIVINDPLISGSHAKIYPGKEGWYIEDLNSTNGTLVDGRLTQRCKLRPGAEISVGNSRMVLFVGLKK